MLFVTYNTTVPRKLFAFIPLVLIVVVAAFFRWWHIDSVAPGISIDEVDYQLTGKSFYLTGTDLKNHTHTLDVLAFHYPTTDDTKAELPYLIQMPFVGPVPFSLPMTRLPFVLMSIGTVILLYFLGNTLVDEGAGVTAAFLGAINPFLVVLGRTNYEVTGAAFFYLLSLFATIKLKGWKILLTIPLWMCAFYVYIGTKVLFIPFLLWSVGLAYFYIHKRKYAKQYLTVIGILFIFIAIFFAILHATPTNRLGELLTPNSKEIISQVNTIRHLSIPSPLNGIVVNKYTIYLRTVANNFFLVFSNNFLVSYGDSFFRLFDHGTMYFVDLIFLITGVVFFAKKKHQLGIYFIGFIVIATFPQIFHDDGGDSTNYAHASLVFPFLVLTAGIGINYFFSLFSKKLLPIIAVIVALTYILSVGMFTQAYFYQYALQGRDDFATRELSKYISLATTEHKKVEVLSPVGATHFKKYLYYANALNASSINEVKHAFISTHLKVGNVSFESCSPHPIFPKGTIVIEDKICGTNDFMDHTTIPLIADGGVAYKIYQDSICNTYNLKQYPSDLKLSDLAVEHLSKTDFCQTFITH